MNLDPAAENFDYPVAMGKQNAECDHFSCEISYYSCIELNCFTLGCLQI